MSKRSDELIHGYFGISLPILWRVVQDDLPLLKSKLLNVQ